MAINIAGIPLRHVTVIRYLGLYIDQHLTWQQNIDYVVSKASLSSVISYTASTFVCLFVWLNVSSFYHSLV